MNYAGVPRETRIAWFRKDIEARLGLRGGRFTGTNSLLWFVVALFLTFGVYGLLGLVPNNYLATILVDRGPTQHVVVLFSLWAILILFVKNHKIRLQRRVLNLRDLIPRESDFVLSPATVGDVLQRVRDACDDPEKFLLLNRIQMALSNLKNMGRIGDVGDVLKYQASNDEDSMESSFSLLNGLLWAIPVLGFIGTVLGLSIAIGKFGEVLQNVEVSELRAHLQEVTAGLSQAFDTTLVALVAALGIQLLLTSVRNSEQRLLDSCQEYCQRHVVGKLRLLPFDHE